jgi:hypothetical protein
MSLTKLYLAGNNLIIPAQGEFGKKSPLGAGKSITFSYSVGVTTTAPSFFTASLCYVYFLSKM